MDLEWWWFLIGAVGALAGRILWFRKHRPASKRDKDWNWA